MVFIVFFIFQLYAQSSEYIKFGSESKIDHCLQSDEEPISSQSSYNGCTQCAEHYELVDDKYNHKKICRFKEECSSLQSSTSKKCSICSNEFRINTISTSYNCEKGEEFADINSYYNGGIYECREGFAHTPEGCRKCENLPHCAETDYACDDCCTCEEGYDLVDGKCEQKPHVYICSVNEYIDENGNCIFNKMEHCAAFMDSRDSTPDTCSADECILCESGFALYGKSCIDIGISNCLRANETGNGCKECYHGYGLVNGNCEKCSDDRCSHCDGNVNTCLSCYNSDDSNIEFETDENGGVLTSWKYSTCKKRVKNCDELDPNDQSKCLQCESGYYFDGTKCSLCGWDVCSSHGEECSSFCQFDGSSYSSYTSDCKQTIGEVYSSASSTASECATCYPGYYLDGSYKCSKCSSNCRFGCAGRADFCLASKILPSITGCKYYADDRTSCIECYGNYELIDGYCDKLSTLLCVTGTSEFGFGKCQLCYDMKNNKYFEPKNGDCREGDKNGADHVLILLMVLLLISMF